MKGEEIRLSDDNFKLIVIELLANMYATQETMSNMVTAILANLVKCPIEEAFSNQAKGFEQAYEILLAYLFEKFGILPSGIKEYLNQKGIDTSSE